jgi:rRNA maturation endonuclease Nob1
VLGEKVTLRGAGATSVSSKIVRMTEWMCACKTYREMPSTDLCPRCGMPVLQRSEVSVKIPKESAR